MNHWRKVVAELMPHYAAAIGGLLGGWQKDSNELNALGANATNQANTQAKAKSEAAKFDSVASKQLEGQQDADTKGLNSGIQAPIPMGRRLGDIMNAATDNSSQAVPSGQGAGASANAGRDAFGAQTPSPPMSYSGGLKDAIHADAQIRTTDATAPNTSGPEALSAGQGAQAAGSGDSTTATAGTGGDSTNAIIGAAGGALSSAIQAGGQGAAGGQIPQAGSAQAYQPTANMSMQQLMQQMQQKKNY